MLEIQSDRIQLYFVKSGLTHCSLSLKILSLVAMHHSRDIYDEIEVSEVVLPCGHYYLSLCSLLAMPQFRGSILEYLGTWTQKPGYLGASPGSTVFQMYGILRNMDQNSTHLKHRAVQCFRG